MEKYIIKEEKSSDTILIFIPNFLNNLQIVEIKKELDSMTDWKHTTKFDGTRIQRKQKWYQTENKSFGKNWKKNYDQWKSHQYSDYLKNFQNMIQDKIRVLIKDIENIPKANFNSLLINYYETINQS